MNARKWVVVLLCALLVSGMFACSKPAQEQAPAAESQPPAVENQAPPAKVEAKTEATPPSEKMETIIQFVMIRKTKPTDFDALTQLYDEKLKGYVTAADKRYGTTLDADVQKALADGKAGKDVYAAAQTAEKSIQRAFILTFQNSLAAIIDGKDGENLAMLKETAPFIDGMAQRRGNSTGTGKEYTETFWATYKAFLDAVESKDAAKIKQTGEALSAFSNKMIVLSVFYELKGLKDTRGTDDNTAAEKLVEARLYHMNLAPEHQKRDAQGSATVTAELAKAPADVDVELVGSILKKDFQSETAGLDKNILGF